MLTEYESDAVLAQVSAPSHASHSTAQRLANLPLPSPSPRSSQWKLQSNQARRLDSHSATAARAGWPVRPPRPEHNLINDDDSPRESLVSSSAHGSTSVHSPSSNGLSPFSASAFALPAPMLSAPTSPRDWFEGSSVSSFSPATPSPALNSSTATTDSVSSAGTAHPQQYRRNNGGNGLFGGRVGTYSKMTKSSSASSVHSLASSRAPSARTRSGSVPNIAAFVNGEDDRVSLSRKGSLSDELEAVDVTESVEEDDDGGTEESTGIGFTRELEMEQDRQAAARPLSRIQLQRISVALDSIAEQISKSFSLEAIDDVADGEEGDLADKEELADYSPPGLSSVDHTEPIDPPFHQVPTYSRRPSVPLLQPAPEGRLPPSPKPDFPPPPAPGSLAFASTAASPFLSHSLAQSDEYGRDSPVAGRQVFSDGSGMVRSPSLASSMMSRSGSQGGHVRSPSLASLASLRKGSPSLASRASVRRQHQANASISSAVEVIENRSPLNVEPPARLSERRESTDSSLGATSPSSAGPSRRDTLDPATFSDGGDPFGFDKSSPEIGRQSKFVMDDSASARMMVAKSPTVASHRSNGSRTSNGSSYHRIDRPVSEATPEQLLKQSSSGQSIVDEEEESLAPTDEPRRDPAELLNEFTSASMGDLVQIQDSLVQSASRRAAAAGRSPHSTPSTFSGEEFDARTAESGGPSPNLGGAQSSAMEPSSSEGSSVGPNSAPTPSTGRSDAFEFQNWVSPDPTREPSMFTAPPDGDDHDQLEHLDEASLSPPVEEIASPTPVEEDEQAAHLVGVALESESAPSTPATSAQGTPDPSADEPVRVARGLLPPRNPNATVSVLVRDVRNQATLATIALKKQGDPRSPPLPHASKSPLSKHKSVRKKSISSPQLVSGPIAIPAVPILNPAIISHHGSPQLKGRAGGYGGEAEPASLGRNKSKIGRRFKALLKKDSHDTFGHLNGDEVTPFVDFEADHSPAEASVSTPPTHDSFQSQFGTPGPDQQGAAQASSLPAAPESEPAPSAPHGRTHDSSGLPSVTERSEQHTSPEHGRERTSSNDPEQSPNTGKGLNRMMSRLRGRKTDSALSSPDSRPLSPVSQTRSSTVSPIRGSISPPLESIAGFRRPSIDEQVLGLGLGVSTSTDGSSRAAASYTVGSPRMRGSPDMSVVPQTAPLSLARSASQRQRQASEGEGAVTPPASAFAVMQRTGSRSSEHSNAPSVSSMRRLWDAAEELGLPRDQLQSLVEHAYPISPNQPGSAGSREGAYSHGHSGSHGSDRTYSDQGEPHPAGHPPFSPAKSSLVGSESFASMLGHSGHHSTKSDASSMFVQSHGVGRMSNMSGLVAGTGAGAGGEGERRGSVDEVRASMRGSAQLPSPLSYGDSNDNGRRADKPSAIRTEKRVSKMSASPSNGSLLAPATPASARPPISPGVASLYSYRSSGYAGSVFDLYGESEEGDSIAPSEGQGRRSGYFGHSAGAGASASAGGATANPMLNESTEGVSYVQGEGGPRPRRREADIDEDGEYDPERDPNEPQGEPHSPRQREDGEVVWSVLDDLRRGSRVSTMSHGDSSVFGFDSPRSSLDSGSLTSPLRGFEGQPTEQQKQDALALLLRHHRRHQQSDSSLALEAPNPRYPSIFVRDEKRLVELGQGGGVAEEERGQFMTRSMSGQELARVERTA